MSIENLHFVSNVFSKDSDNKSIVQYNDDGTLSLDVIRTGIWSHYWYGIVEFTIEKFNKIIENFNNTVIGYVLTFNYHHDRRENFGKVVRLYTQERDYKGQTVTFLIADVALTEKAREDVEAGNIYNFSAEIDENYISRDMTKGPAFDDEGNQLVDEDGQPILTNVKTKYGCTLMGGAVTNYPFITGLNPNGLGGNRNVIGKDEQALYSYKANTSKENTENIMVFSLLSGNKVLSPPKTYCDWNGLMNSGYHLAIIQEYDELLKFNILHNEFAENVHAVYSVRPSGTNDIIYELIAVAFDNSINNKDCEKWLNENNFRSNIFYYMTKQVDNPMSTVELKDESEENKDVEPKNKPDTADVTSVFTTEAFEQRLAAIEASFAEKLSAQQMAFDAKLGEIVVENLSLKADVNVAKERAFAAEVDSVVASGSFANANPAFKSVMKRALIGNRDLNIKYRDTENDQYSDITLRDLFGKIVETVEFAAESDNDDTHEFSGGRAPVNVVDDADDDDILTVEDVAIASKDDQKFSDLLSDLELRRLPGYVFKKSAVAGN
jgi:hypothetical protein